VLQQRDAENLHFIEQLVKEVLAGVSDAEFQRLLHDKFVTQHAQKYSVKNMRALDNAQARDGIDRWVADLKEQARRLKKRSDDFQDVELLATHVDTLARALASYEEMTEPEFGSPRLLNELKWVLFLVQYLTGPITKMTKDRAKMASVRAERSSKSLGRDKDLTERAIASLKHNPTQSKRSVAHNIALDLGLKPNTVEKKLAAAWTAVKKSIPANK
jgi:hypothetical protein